jgi:hypothetical protein
MSVLIDRDFTRTTPALCDIGALCALSAQFARVPDRTRQFGAVLLGRIVALIDARGTDR